MFLRRCPKIGKCDSFVISVRPSVRMEQIGSQCTDFREFWYMSTFFFFKSVERIQDSLKYDKNNGYCTWRPTYIYYIFFAELFVELEMFRTKSRRENQNTQFKFSNFFSPRKSCRFCDIVEKFCRARQATDGSIIWRRSIACWIKKTSDTHSEQVMLIPFSRSWN